MFDLQPKIRELIQEYKKRPLAGEGIHISSYHQCCLEKYRRKCLSRLMKMTKTERGEQPNDIALRQSLKAYLSENWEKVKGSYLSYTSMPHEMVTEMLLQLADIIQTEEVSK